MDAFLKLFGNVNIGTLLSSLIPTAANAIKLAQMALDAGKDAGPHVVQAFQIFFKGKVLTDAERKAQDDQMKAYSDIIQAPLKD